MRSASGSVPTRETQAIRRLVVEQIENGDYLHGDTFLDEALGFLVPHGRWHRPVTGGRQQAKQKNGPDFLNEVEAANIATLTDRCGDSPSPTADDDDPWFPMKPPALRSSS
jgi:hypothetical protein